MAIRLVTRFKNNRFLSNALDATGKELHQKKWIFIIGCYNSGTTLLQNLLSQHEDISGTNEEGVMLTDSLKRPEDFGWRRMWCECEEKMMVPKNSESDIAIRIKKQWSHFYDVRKPFFIEKSIANTPRMLFFERNFQPVYFIHLVRNGYAVAEGIVRKAAVMSGNPYRDNGNYPIELGARQWRRSLEVVDRDKNLLKNFIEIKYEDFTASPKETLSRVTQFLQVDFFSEELLNQSFYVHQKTGPISNLNNRSLEKLSSNDLIKINSVAADFLKKYGYYQSPK